ncbi:MAG: hypothetical protein GC179_14315 [Anaerolineaceae bacterium]|nr:hypothetical protein [Anaerolineaceae bacterium]
MNKKLLILAVLLAILAAACSPAGNISRRNPGTLRDYIFSVEPRNNGSYIIWMRNDDVAAYCTTDKALGDTALQAIHSRTGLIIMEYRNREALDKESRDVNQGGCAVESTGSKNDTTPIFKILSIEIVSQE